MTIIDQQIACIHVEIDAASDAYRRRLHDAVRSWQDVHQLNADLQALVKQQRGEIEILKNECEQHRRYVDQLEAERKDALAANRTYGRLLTDVRGALGAVEDADLAEEAKRICSALFSAREQTGALTRECQRLQGESEGRLEQRRLEWIRAERAESACERLRVGIALARVYKAAVDGLNGAADAEAALFAWLEEVEHV